MRASNAAANSAAADSAANSAALTGEPADDLVKKGRRTNWLRDPLWLFLALGILLFWLDSRSDQAANTIEVTSADKARLAAQWQAQTRRDPTAQELAGLVEQFIEEEVYYREAIALKLDTNDTIIRRRLVQKLVFLTEDLATAAEPSDAQLQDFYANNKNSYEVPKKYSFAHIYFSRDRRDDAFADALAALELARRNDGDPVGDPFILQSNFGARSKRDMAGTFGSQFADALDGLPQGRWSEPVESAYGWHLIKLRNTEDPFIPSFDALNKRLRNDYQSENRTKANNRFKAQLRSKYQVVEEP